jgi:hypothetical protein
MHFSSIRSCGLSSLTTSGAGYTETDTEYAKNTLFSWLRDPKLDRLPGLHFRNVLGDALRDERGLARRLSRIA